MTTKPPAPDANKSPYPLDEATQEARAEHKAELASEGGETLKALKEDAAARRRREGLSRTAIGVGAAVGIGSAALAGALLYWNRRNDKG